MSLNIFYYNDSKYPFYFILLLEFLRNIFDFIFIENNLKSYNCTLPILLILSNFILINAQDFQITIPARDSLMNEYESIQYEPDSSIYYSSNTLKELSDGTIWREENNLNGYKIAGVLGAIAIVDFAGYNQLKNLWYTQRHSYWHSLDFTEDFRKYRWMDKFGHAMDAYFVSDLTAKAYRWSGFSGNSSILLGALTGWLWMMQIEISDGFFLEWGYSWGDVLANSVGSGFYILQQTNYELFGGLHPKISYHKSNAWKEARYIKVPGSIIDDYEGMTFWLGVNPYHYFPESWKQDYPKWLAPLGIAFGYGAKGIGIDPQGGRHEFFVGLDIDISKIPIGEGSGLVKFLKSEFNFIRLPLPAVRITPSGVWYGLYF